MSANNHATNGISSNIKSLMQEIETDKYSAHREEAIATLKAMVEKIENDGEFININTFAHHTVNQDIGRDLMWNCTGHMTMTVHWYIPPKGR